ncbi:hypothetical protein TIFTF001_039679 [Ficus carica]|uniref:Uncharacterized protein n=1 Tax=Ficus carica TaxID=3494 RepID=A0AA88EFT3_FICCA|nr:hypothetical protein TIFTF001_039679 [Ficus carica]
MEVLVLFSGRTPIVEINQNRGFFGGRLAATAAQGPSLGAAAPKTGPAALPGLQQQCRGVARPGPRALQHQWPRLQRPAKEK